MSMTAEQAEARQQAVLGQPMRIAPLAEHELGAEVRALVERIGAAVGYENPEELTIYFALMARHPGFFRCQMETGIMFLGEARIPFRERELAVLRTAWLVGAPYEWSEHIRIARKLGVSAEETERLTIGSAAPGWTPHERALLCAVEELVADRMISDPTWALLAQSYDEQQLIELPALVGQYLGVAMIQNSLRVPLTEFCNGFADR